MIASVARRATVLMSLWAISDVQAASAQGRKRHGTARQSVGLSFEPVGLWCRGHGTLVVTLRNARARTIWIAAPEPLDGGLPTWTTGSTYSFERLDRPNELGPISGVECSSSDGGTCEDALVPLPP